jgi:hypothetical protein
VYDNRVRKSLLVSSIGLVILFSSIALAPLQYSLYPPYGLITEAFIPLGAYLLLVGIFTSAVHISRDAAIRRELYRSAINQLDLLRSIGTSEMEKELEGRVKHLERVHRISEVSPPSEIEEETDVENVKKYCTRYLRRCTQKIERNKLVIQHEHLLLANRFSKNHFGVRLYASSSFTQKRHTLNRPYCNHLKNNMYTAMRRVFAVFIVIGAVLMLFPQFLVV